MAAGTAWFEGIAAMRDPAIVRMLPDGRRMHLHDGPIDLIVEANGKHDAISAAYEAAAQRFVTVLDDLCGELPLLRAQVRRDSQVPRGAVAKRMAVAVAPYAEKCFITPMAAVAGAVAEEILYAMTGAAELTRAYVNNGGDIALRLGPEEHYKVGMVERPDRPSLFGAVEISYAMPVRGIATSGWRGRSFSLGIADAVTVLAETAAMADAAATIIANAVDLPKHPAITRVPANEIAPDSDLRTRLVTRAVGALRDSEAVAALESGANVARELQELELAVAAALNLQGHTRVVSAADGREFMEFSQGSLLHA
ncbi:MAG: hypothetical protein WCE52_19345 [Candidatus Acidiferrum sp.]